MKFWFKYKKKEQQTQRRKIMQSGQYGRLDVIKVMKDKAIPRNSMEDGALL